MIKDTKETTLYVVGLSYKKADAKTRSLFSITKENQQLLLEEAQQNHDGVIVLSTCNRTELIGFAHHPYELISLLCKYSNGPVEAFVDVSYVYKDKEAIHHLFKIATGLDSQIIGDYEIVSQLKQAFKQAKKVGAINPYLERLMNAALQASKSVKNHTKLSSGTTSVSYAAIQYAQENVIDFESKNILVYGLGAIGKNTCKNLIEYTTNEHIVLINRTFEKAADFSANFNRIEVKPEELLKEEISKSDVLIVSTGAAQPTISLNHIGENREKPLLILDLSIPENVDNALRNIQGINLVNVDQLSLITQKTIEQRKEEVVKAEAIILKYKEEFMDWVSQRKFTPAVNELKEVLISIQKDEINFHSKKIKDFNSDHAEEITGRFIQKITTQFVKHLKAEETSVDTSIEVMRKVFSLNEDESKI